MPKARRDRPELAPIAAVLALLLLLALQLAMPSRATPVDDGGLAMRRPRLVATPEVPEYPAILRAPVFAPDRRPGESGPRPAGSAAATADEGGLSAYAALGAASGRGAATAIVAGPNGVAKTVKLGEILQGWRLVGVSPTAVVFARNGARRVLMVGAPAEAGPPQAGQSPSSESP